MNNIDIAKAVLNNQKNDDGTLKYPNVQIKGAKNERCDYDGPDNTTCYVQEKNQNLIDKIIASHEVCHFLNYEEGVTNFKEVRKTNSWVAYLGVIFIIAISTVIVYFNIELIQKLNFLYVLLCSVLACFISYNNWRIVEEKLRIYSNDEQKTQDRAVQELLAINDEYELNLNKEELVTVAQKHIDRYVYGINNMVRVGMLLALFFTGVLNSIILFSLMK